MILFHPGEKSNKENSIPKKGKETKKISTSTVQGMYSYYTFINNGVLENSVQHIFSSFFAKFLPSSI